jgi:hypothetical protein
MYFFLIPVLQMVALYSIYKKQYNSSEYNKLYIKTQLTSW